MAITVYTKPDKYSAAYSALPLRVKSSNVKMNKNFKYLTNIIYDKVDILSGESFNYDGGVYTEIVFTDDHKFKQGDQVIINAGYYSGIYNVVYVNGTDKVLIDLILGQPFSGNYAGKVISYQLSPDYEEEMKLDLSSTMKDFVTQNLEDVNETFNAKDTVFKYDIAIGEQCQYTFNFDDNHYTAGMGVGFVNWNLDASDIPNLPFTIGDSINIQQEQVEWEFTSTNGYAYDNMVKVWLESTFKHDFRAGQQLLIQEATPEAYLNGPTSIIIVVDNPPFVDKDYQLVIDKQSTLPLVSNTGKVVGVPRPEYNTVATITDIYFASGYGVVVVTDIPYTGGSSNPIGGKITYADERLTRSLFETVIQDNYVYNARTETLNYSIDEFNKYVIQNRNSELNNISTILGNDKKYRIEKSSKSWLLAHTDTDVLIDEIKYRFYDKSNNILGEINMSISGGNNKDFYFPVGINQVLNSLNTSGTISLSTYIDDIAKYDVFCVNSGNTQLCNKITFEVNNDCSKYEMYHLMWKDRRGSWLSYPFKYVNNKITEFEHKTFYKKTGIWNLDTNDFGYNSFDRGETSYYNRSRDKMILNSGWVEEFENELIKDLLISGSVYLQRPDGKLIGCNINNKEMKFGQDINDSLWNYNLEIRMSINDYRF